MNTARIATRTLLSILAASALCACSSSTPRWDQAFGHTVKQITAMQTLNPQGSAPEILDGIDGIAASQAQTSYANAFASPQQAGAHNSISGLGANQ